MKWCKYSVLFFILFLLTSSVCLAQSQPRTERIHRLKIAYITNRVHLSASQAERFWPVYYRFEDELRNTRQRFLKDYLRENRADRSREDARRFVENNLDYQEALIGLKRKYEADFLKIISPEQLTDLYEADKEFKQMLLRKLNQRKERG